MTKPGFAPFQFKVVPQQDKDVLASLQRVAGRPSFAAASMAGAPARLPAGSVAGAPPRLAAGAVAGPPARLPAGAAGGPPARLPAAGAGARRADAKRARRPAPAAAGDPAMTDRKPSDAPEEDFAAMFAAAEKTAGRARAARGSRSAIACAARSCRSATR